MEDLLLAWPDAGKQILELKSGEPFSLDHAVLAIRSGEISGGVIESYLLSHKCRGGPETIDLALAFLYFTCLDKKSFDRVISELRCSMPDLLEVKILTIVGWLWADDAVSLRTAPSSIWSGLESSILLRLCRCSYLLKIGDIAAAFELLSDMANSSLEAIMLKAKIYAFSGEHLQAVDLLMPLLERAPKNLRLYKQLLQHQFDAKDSREIKRVACQALEVFGEHPQILYHCTALNLFQRQPGLARRSALLQQVWSSVQTTPIVFGNQVNTYEANGSPEWSEFLLPQVINLPLQTDAQLHSNLVMQLASSQSKKYQDYVNRILLNMSHLPECKEFEYASPGVPVCSPTTDQLRVGWITGDLYYHPVGRFLLSFFVNSRGSLKHFHEIVSTQECGKESLAEFFRSDAGINVVQLSGDFDKSRVTAVRSRTYDVVVDLSGWTGGNFIAGFLARLAPVQVNYLGYFASTMLPTMDYWIGDSSLFPSDYSEFSTEKIWRLQRSFLAWQPVDPLPEASIDVTDAPVGPIRFGSFNHNRKLSDATLKLWGKLLQAVPGARLVLKASSKSDSDTQGLLRRRMLRQGLDPARVDWLALTKGPTEHMKQYAHIDIALDPIPNGGCTTTCEALWMGVPTITLAGSHYVSRMSTAVLSAANMSEWISRDCSGYIDLGHKHAARVNELRANRQQWRQKVQGSSLGDAGGLMHHLEDAFSKMHLEMLRRA